MYKVHSKDTVFKVSLYKYLMRKRTPTFWQSVYGWGEDYRFMFYSWKEIPLKSGNAYSARHPQSLVSLVNCETKNLTCMLDRVGVEACSWSRCYVHSNTGWSGGSWSQSKLDIPGDSQDSYSSLMWISGGLNLEVLLPSCIKCTICYCIK